jgi:hypothetical protein
MIKLLFSPEAKWLWTVAMMVALFFPVRKLIWVMTVRRAIKKNSLEHIDEIEKTRLMKRAGITAGLLSFLFSLFYVSKIFSP